VSASLKNTKSLHLDQFIYHSTVNYLDSFYSKLTVAVVYDLAGFQHLMA